MFEVEPGEFHTDLLGFFKSKKPGGARPHSIQQVGSQDSRNKKQNQAPHHNVRFTDKDIDILLKKSGIEINPENRRLARFFLVHHVQLKADIFKLANEISPHSPPQGLRADAFIAALSKLPIDQVKQGYEIILSTLTSNHPSVMGSIHQLKEALTDLVSETFNIKNLAIPPETIRAGIGELIEMWNNILEDDPVHQIKTLVWRRALIYKLHRQIRLSMNLLTLLNKIHGEEQFKALQGHLSKTIASAKQALNLLLSDAILSREDVHHHLSEQGARHSLGIEINHCAHTCRLWVHDRDNPSSRVLDPENIVLYFRWFTQELGVLESRVNVQDDQIELSFASTHAPVRETLEQDRERIEERLSALGFQVKQLPTKQALRLEDEDAEIHTTHDKLSHLDLQA